MADLGGTFTAEQGLLAALAKPRAKTEKVELGQQNMQFSMTEKDGGARAVEEELLKARARRRLQREHSGVPLARRVTARRSNGRQEGDRKCTHAEGD